MRLIDADELKNQEVLEKLRTAEFDDEIEDVIEKIPTAYDVDKVVKRLEDMKYVMMGNYGVRREVVNFDDLVEIVKSGGIE